MNEFALERVRSYGARTAIILGSGLSSLVSEPDRDKVIAYSEIGGLPRSTVKGHAGRFVLGEMGAVRVVLAQGRVHLYEGYSAREVTAGIRFLARAGIERLILTNAAGAINPKFSPGDWMILRDHLNLTATSPLIGQGSFTDLVDAYSARWRAVFRQSAAQIGLTLHEGVYAGMIGPQYETPAEVRMLHSLGADAVGMSTVCETIQARALGVEVAAFSCLTNRAAGLAAESLTHQGVLEAGMRAAGTLQQLLQAALPPAT